MHPSDLLLLQLEALAVADRLRRDGEHADADRVEDWAHSQDLLHQLAQRRPLTSS